MNISSIHNAWEYDSRNINIKNRALSGAGADSSISTFDIASLVSQKDAKIVEKSDSPTKSPFMHGMSSDVKSAWEKAEQETGFNPFTDSDGKIVGSALLAQYIEMEYKLSVQYGMAAARSHMSSIFSDEDSARELISKALERAKNPLLGDINPTQLDLEKRFYESFLSHMGE